LSFDGHIKGQIYIFFDLKNQKEGDGGRLFVPHLSFSLPLTPGTFTPYSRNPRLCQFHEPLLLTSGILYPCPHLAPTLGNLFFASPLALIPVVRERIAYGFHKEHINIMFGHHSNPKA